MLPADAVPPRDYTIEAVLAHAKTLCARERPVSANGAKPSPSDSGFRKMDEDSLGCVQSFLRARASHSLSLCERHLWHHCNLSIPGSC